MIKNFTEYKITTDQLSDIFNFIAQSLYEFQNYNIQKKDIKVLIPEYVLFIMRNNIDVLDWYSYCVSELRINKILGIEVYPHFKNEIVVYTTKFYYNQELYGLKIKEIV
jgi:hypothetical protein